MRKFNQIIIDREHLNLIGRHVNELIYNCSIDSLSNVELINCDLSKSKFLIDDINNLKNFSLTLDCGSFKDVTLSPLIFDLILMLLLKTKGNDTKRKKLISVIGKDRMKDLFAMMEGIEL
jgi:hypothetical protein